MQLVEKMDEFGRGGWIVAMVLGFFLFWPVGLAMLAFLIGSGRLGRRWYCAPGEWRAGRWYNQAGDNERRACGWGWGGPRRGRGRRHAGPPPSGNHAFDEYRAETLRRLEREQQEFVEYLERLRQAKDKAEFDQFMAERRPQPPQGE